MKKKDLNALRAKKKEELKKMVDEKKLELFKFTAKLKVGEEKNLKKGFFLRKEMAKLLTIIKENELLAKEDKK